MDETDVEKGKALHDLYILPRNTRKVYEISMKVLFCTPVWAEKSGPGGPLSAKDAVIKVRNF